jgi:hypothetical protein
MKLLLTLLVAACFSCAFAQTDIKPFATRQDAARLIDYNVGTFVNDHLTIRISAALPMAGISPDDVKRPSYQISLIDESGIRQTVVHRQGEKLYGEIQEEGTTFRFSVEASKDALAILCDGERFTFKRVSKFPANPFGPRSAPAKTKGSTR